MKKVLFIALSLGFIMFGISAYLQSKPAPKSERVYRLIQKYSPYYLDKRFGGLQIMSREDKEFKEKPDNMEVFHRFEALEKQWGKRHLQLNGTTLSILDNNGSMIKAILLKTPKETHFVQTYYGL